MFYATLREYLLSALPGTNASDRIELTKKAVEYAREKKDTELLIMAAVDHSLGSRISNAPTTLEDFTLNDIPKSVTEKQFVNRVSEFYQGQGYDAQGEQAPCLHVFRKDRQTLVANISFAHDHCFITINDYSKEPHFKAE